MVPTIVRISAIFNMANPIHVLEWSEVEKATRTLGVEPRLFDIRNRDDIERAFDTARDEHSDALTVGADTITQLNRTLVVEIQTSIAARQPM
jgi:hypothetical protein